MRKLKVIGCILFVLFALVSTFPLGAKWQIITLGLFSIPLITLFQKNKTIQAYAIWFGIFLLAQSLISPAISNRSLKTLKPGVRKPIDLQGGVPGIIGVQEITTDDKGFRTTKHVNYKDKDKRVFRIFAIGGSTTEQIYLDDRSTWTHLLQEKLSNSFQEKEIEVINTGVSGTRISHHYFMLKEIKQYNPDMVIFLVGFNDWNHHIVTHFYPPIDFTFDKTLLGRTIRRNYEAFVQYRLSSHNEMSQAQPIVEDVYKEKRGSLSRKTRKTYKPETVPSYYKDYLLRIVSFCNQNDIKCVFLTQPTGYHEKASDEYKKSFWMTPAETKYTLDFESMVHISDLYNRFIMTFALSNGVHVIDLSTEIPGSFEYMYDDCHFNVDGANKVAEVIYEYLKPALENRFKETKWAQMTHRKSE